MHAKFLRSDFCRLNTTDSFVPPKTTINVPRLARVNVLFHLPDIALQHQDKRCDLIVSFHQHPTRRLRDAAARVEHNFSHPDDLFLYIACSVNNEQNQQQENVAPKEGHAQLS